MKGYIFTICIAMVTTIAFAYNGLEYRGVPSHTSCTGQCYVDYVALNGTPAEMEQRKKELASTDEFSDIRSLWTGCAACHGAEGQGVAVFPKLAGQSQDYIVGRLNAYRNGEAVGAMSSTMWAQAGGLSDAQINMIGKFIEVELK
jgi:cytochrome c553